MSKASETAASEYAKSSCKGINPEWVEREEIEVLKASFIAGAEFATAELFASPEFELYYQDRKVE